MQFVIAFLNVVLLVVFSKCEDYLNEFAVEVDGDAEVAELVANIHGFRVQRQLNSLGNVYLFTHPNVQKRNKRSANLMFSNQLTKDPSVLYVEQLQLLKRDKREYNRFKSRYVSQNNKHYDLEMKNSIESTNIKHLQFNDPYYKDQWYLNNQGQTGGKTGSDMNILPVWRNGYSGEGVVVSVLDDGVDHNHPDLIDNYDPKASTDLNDPSDAGRDPVPNFSDDSNSHGTKCAGEIASRGNNSNCGVGIAFKAKIGGVRMLDGLVTDLVEAEALSFNNQYVDIYSASWGPTDDGKTMEGPHRYARNSLKEGAMKGRKGRGSIFVWASGNGGAEGDYCSADGYASSIYTLAIGSISDEGLSTYFSEICPSVMGVVHAGGSHKQPGDPEYVVRKVKVVTTDLHGDCTLDFQGTSSAAPLAAGCMALVLEAKPNLTWRDIQHIVANTALIPNDAEEGWILNGAGFHLNHKFGFGALDCSAMVEKAQTWRQVPEQIVCKSSVLARKSLISRGGMINQSLNVTACQQSITSLEHVEVHVVMTHKRRGNVEIKLTSPSLTTSDILKPRRLDTAKDGINFTFMTIHNWGENPVGEWVLTVIDNSNQTDETTGSIQGSLISWYLILYGSKDSQKRSTTKEFSRSLNQNEVTNIIKMEQIKNARLQIQPRNIGNTQPKNNDITKEYFLPEKNSGTEFLEGLDSDSLGLLEKLFRGDDQQDEEFNNNSMAGELITYVRRLFDNNL